MGWKRLNRQAGQSSSEYALAYGCLFIWVLLVTALGLFGGGAIRVLGLIGCAISSAFLTFALGAQFHSIVVGQQFKFSLAPTFLLIFLLPFISWLVTAITPVVTGSAWLTLLALIVGVLGLCVFYVRDRYF